MRDIRWSTPPHRSVRKRAVLARCDVREVVADHPGTAGSSREHAPGEDKRGRGGGGSGGARVKSGVETCEYRNRVCRVVSVGAAHPPKRGGTPQGHAAATRIPMDSCQGMVRKNLLLTD